jgi:hypothetical protein
MPVSDPNYCAGSSFPSSLPTERGRVELRAARGKGGKDLTAIVLPDPEA